MGINKEKPGGRVRLGLGGGGEGAYAPKRSVVSVFASVDFRHEAGEWGIKEVSHPDVDYFDQRGMLDVN